MRGCAGFSRMNWSAWSIADSGSPTLVRDPKDDSALYVLMPMRV